MASTCGLCLGLCGSIHGGWCVTTVCYGTGGSGCGRDSASSLAFLKNSLCDDACESLRARRAVPCGAARALLKRRSAMVARRVLSVSVLVEAWSASIGVSISAPVTSRSARFWIVCRGRLLALVAALCQSSHAYSIVGMSQPLTMARPASLFAPQLLPKMRRSKFSFRVALAATLVR